MISNKTEFNSDWEEVSLEELGEFNRGKSKYRPRDAKELFGGKYPFIQTGDIKEANLYVEQYSKTYNEFGLSQSKLWPKGTLCITIAANIAETAILKFDACFPDSIVGFQEYKGKSDVYFMHYLFCYIKKKIQNATSGSVQDNINLAFLKKLKLQVPNITIQKRISSILFSLDKKIELNNEMNKTLEEMAHALFKRWFIDFEFSNEEGNPYKSSGGEMIECAIGMIPKGWKVKKLQDISYVTMGVSPNSSSYNEVQIGLPLLNGAADFEGKLIKPNKYTSEPKKVCNVGDLVFGVRATIGNTVFADKEYALGRGVASVSPKSDMFREFIYFSLDTSMNKLIANASGSVFLNLKKAEITDLKICFSETTIDKYNKIAKVLIDKIIENDKESEILKQQRDSLLPKLMSGEISVEDIKASL